MLTPPLWITDTGLLLLVLSQGTTYTNSMDGSNYFSLGRWDRLYDMIEEMEKQRAPLDPQIVHAITSSVRASDLVRGFLEFPLNQVHVQAYKQSKVQSPKIDPATSKLFKGFLNDVKPVLLANVFNPPAPAATTQAAQV